MSVFILLAQLVFDKYGMNEYMHILNIQGTVITFKELRKVEERWEDRRAVLGWSVGWSQMMESPVSDDMNLELSNECKGKPLEVFDSRNIRFEILKGYLWTADVPSPPKRAQSNIAIKKDLGLSPSSHVSVDSVGKG